MKHIHSTTKNPSTYLRLIVILLFSIFLVLILPYPGRELADFITARIFNIGIIYSIVVGFLMFMSLGRRQSLGEYVAIELNKTRRIYHLGLYLSQAEPRLKGWFVELCKATEDYLSMFRESSFDNYESGNALFRKITRTIYSLPASGLPYNSELYSALLTASASVTEAREFIRSKKDDGIGHFQWLVMITISLTFSILVALVTPLDIQSRAVSVLIIFNVFLVLQLLYEYDHANKMRSRNVADLYVHDLISLQERITSAHDDGAPGS